jgi:hypothetical protein
MTTAEALAELQRRPLLNVTASELCLDKEATISTRPFALAERWGAILVM